MEDTLSSHPIRFVTILPLQHLTQITRMNPTILFPTLTRARSISKIVTPQPTTALNLR
jgi:hypothetical protein